MLLFPSSFDSRLAIGPRDISSNPSPLNGGYVRAPRGAANRYQDARSRRNYAGTSPLTKASGKKRVVEARFVRNPHLADACYRWAFCALSASPGARAFYDLHRARDETHDQALRVLSNRLVGILDGCLRSRSRYDERKAWGHRAPDTYQKVA